MRILVRQAGSECYLNPNGQWGVKVSAREFPDLQAAGREALRFEDAEVVLWYEQPSCQIALNPAYCTKQTRPRVGL